MLLPPCLSSQRLFSAKLFSELKLVTDNLLSKYSKIEFLDYPRARAHPGCEVGSHGAESTCIVGSSVLRQGQPDSGEGCIVLQSEPTRSLVARFPQRSVVACSTRIEFRSKEHCEPGHGKVMSWRPKCIRAMSSVDLPLNLLRKN